MHCHTGSNPSEPNVISGMSKEVSTLTKQIPASLGLRITKIDFGGDLGFPYQPAMTYDECASSVLADNITSCKDFIILH
jgi:diaminopimelate decarboxylase